MTHKIKITFFDGTVKWIQANSKKLQKARNVLSYVFDKYKISAVQKIETRKTGVNDPSYKFFELHFDYQFEIWRQFGKRVEATNPKGHEDYTGYGNRTDGKKNRFYIGKSTGFLPIYLEVLKSNSTGGGSLYLTKGRTFESIN